jgi:hypothetical protein
MADSRRVNVFDDEWGNGYPQVDGWRANHKRVTAGSLAVGIYELLPGRRSARTTSTTGTTSS